MTKRSKRHTQRDRRWGWLVEVRSAVINAAVPFVVVVVLSQVVGVRVPLG